jgi:endonuclease/exonuclease/phosphatase family metal-dependent hydrolase
MPSYSIVPHCATKSADLASPHREASCWPAVGPSSGRDLIKASASRSRRWLLILGALAAALGGLVIHGTDRRPVPAAQWIASGPVTSPPRVALRVATFNMHSAIGRDGRYDLDRAGRTVQGFDLVALNEVRHAVSFRPSQVQSLAQASHLNWLFAASERRWWHGHFGNGLLSNLPIAAWKSIPLDGTRGKGYRNVLLVDIPCGATCIHLMVTHVDRDQDRAAQLEAVGSQFLALPTPALLLGDLNSTAADPALAPLLQAPGVQDALKQITEVDPNRRIDWILVRGLEVVTAGVRDIGASDHPCYWAEVRIGDIDTQQKPPAIR